ncbi:MAG: BlaI/MecI/CopY family transcriptional regulator [Peptococcaceae bacterium]|nr:BlaI/MecI/CopY family transcriptional regulator [Peptococcaceae bacterium]
MRILWREERPVPYGLIRKELELKMGWKKSTTQTLITRLREKGVIDALCHGVLLYTPNITEQEYMNSEEQDFLDRLFEGNAVNLVSALCQNGKLKKDDIDILMNFFLDESS